MSTTVRSMGMCARRDPGNAGFWSLRMDITCFAPPLPSEVPTPLLCLQHNLKAEPSCGSLACSPQPTLGQGREEGPWLRKPLQVVSQREGEILQTGGMSSHVGAECPGQILPWQASVPQGQFFAKVSG